MIGWLLQNDLREILLKKDHSFMMIEDSFEKRNERIGTIVILSMLIILIFLVLVKQCVIDKKGKYVVGRLIRNSSGGSETGKVYYFEYYYDGRRIVTSFEGPLGGNAVRDSLIFIKVLPKNPELCEVIRNMPVPSCIKFSSVPELGWGKIPVCQQ
jgi:hypothetical protein